MHLALSSTLTSHTLLLLFCVYANKYVAIQIYIHLLLEETHIYRQAPKDKGKSKNETVLSKTCKFLLRVMLFSVGQRSLIHAVSQTINSRLEIKYRTALLEGRNQLKTRGLITHGTGDELRNRLWADDAFGAIDRSFETISNEGLKRICQDRFIPSRGNRQDLFERLLHDHFFGTMSHKDLKRQCQRRFIVSRGSREDLIRRLLNYNRRKGGVHIYKRRIS